MHESHNKHNVRVQATSFKGNLLCLVFWHTRIALGEGFEQHKFERGSVQFTTKQQQQMLATETVTQTELLKQLGRPPSR